MGPQEHPRGQQQGVILVELGELGVAPVVGPHVRAVQQRDSQVVVPDLGGKGVSAGYPGSMLQAPADQAPGHLGQAGAQKLLSGWWLLAPGCQPTRGT